MISDWIGPAVVAALVSSGMNGLLMMRENRKNRTADMNFAERKFQYERDLHDHKRRVELAETVLSNFYQCVDVFREVRGPVRMQGEADERIRQAHETPQEAELLDAYFVPLARIGKHSVFLSDMMSRRYRSRAVLGVAIDEAFEKVREAGIDIQAAASTLRDIARGGKAAAANNEPLIRQCQSTIWQGKGDDPILPLLGRAIEVAETVCRPILERKQ